MSAPDMKAVIFAAGLGTRLRPITDVMPKPLIPVGGKPILTRTLEAMPDSVSDVIIIVGYKAEMIRASFEDSATPLFRRMVRPENPPLKSEAGRVLKELSIRFVEQHELRGTYDALLRAAPLLADGPFLALNGDDIYAREDLERLASSAPSTMLAKRVPAPNPYSHLDVEDGFLRRIVRNADAVGLDAHAVYVGACLLDREFFALEPAQLPNGELGLPHTLEKHVDKNPVRVIEAEAWHPIGTPEELAAAEKALDPGLR